MSQTNQSTALYQLSGESLVAAKRLLEEVNRQFEMTPAINEGLVIDIQRSWASFYKTLHARIEQDTPDILELTGLKMPSIRVYKGNQTLPRAYVEYPQIFLSPEKEPSYYMYCPLDYKGQHFVPKDAFLLDEQQTQAVGGLLFAGGWLGNAPIFDMGKSGVPTPTDYTPPVSTELATAFSFAQNDKICFLAAGRSLQIIEDCKARDAVWRKSVEAATEAITAETLKTKPQILATLPEREDVNISTSYSYYSQGGSETTLILSIRRAGKNNFLETGKPVTPLPSPAYTLENHHDGEYVVKPRNDTPEGLALSAIINSIPLTAGPNDYPELFSNYAVNTDEITNMVGINGTVPNFVEIGGFNILVYNCANEKTEGSDFCPPDAIPFPTEAYEWLRSDEGDCNTGVSPPPMPEKLAAILAQVSPNSRAASPISAAEESPKPL